MSDLASARAKFLAQAEFHASGQSARLAPALDELIRWSQEQGLTLAKPSGVQHTVKFCTPESRKPFWSVLPRSGDGAKLTFSADPEIPEALLAEVRAELAQMTGKPGKPDAVPEVGLAQLIWVPHRERVLGLMARLLAALRGQDEPAAAAEPAAAVEESTQPTP